MSPNNKTDKRVIKTKDSLKRALVQLLSNHKLECISIKSLTDAAGINRKTFYLHYKNVRAVYDEIINNLNEKLVSKLIDTDLSLIYQLKLL